jgi:class 3 adenylate cyclase/CHASE2 domain-containing sensor protein
MKLRTLLVAVAAYAVATCLFLPGPWNEWVQKLDITGLEMRYRFRGEVAPASNLRVVGITQAFVSNLAELGDNYPFPRDIHAVALQRLADAGTKTIVVDILFSEDGSWELAEDEALRDAISYCHERGCEVVLACGIEFTNIGGGTRSVSLIEPAETIMEAQPRLGASNTEHKLDYKLHESASVNIELEGRNSFYTQPVEALLAATDTSNAEAPKLIEHLTGGTGRYRINYFGPADTAGLTYSYERLFPEAVDDATWLEIKSEREALLAGGGTSSLLAAWPVLEQDVASELRRVFDGAVVFLGSRNNADNDYFNTPYGMMFGVDTLAQSFDTLYRKRLVHEVPLNPLWPWVTAVAGLLALTAWGVALLRPIRTSVIAAVIVLLLVISVNFALFRLESIELSFTLATAGFALPYLACIIYGGAAEEGQRKRIHDTFSPYLSDELVNVIIADPSIADLGGKYFRGAVMFNDIRSYSTITENLDARQIVEMLNLYLGEMASVIRDNHGFVDKFMGDGLLAFFGGPVAKPDSAADAVRASLAMVRVLHEKVHPRLWDMGLPPLKIGIGLHYGDVVMGTIGSVQRKNYTVVGDAVNVAARVEAQTKEYGWAILATQEVVDAAGPEFDFEFAGHQLVKGRSRPVELYRLLDPEYQAMYHLDGAGLVTIEAGETSVRSVEG